MKAMPITVIEIYRNNILVRKALYEDLKELIYTLVQLIPIGHVVTYSDIAKILGINPRLVGIILSKNNQPIIIPCHRVISSKGLGGYTLLGKKALNLKNELLQIESRGRIAKINLCDYLGLNKLCERHRKL